MNFLQKSQDERRVQVLNTNIYVFPQLTVAVLDSRGLQG